jgi:filamentous hemagglutinin family protein
MLRFLSITALFGLGSVLISFSSVAQPIPDGTTATPDPGSCVPQCQIRGGDRLGSNLFHSFESFSVLTGEMVLFVPPRNVDTVITRVTGTDSSWIDGQLGVRGNADLFLLNPNGIIFGANASLNLNGSLLLTTAQGYVFEDGSQFSAIAPDAPPLLAVQTPIGLQYGRESGAIAIQDSALLVDSGQSLLLAGGEIALNNAFLGVDFPDGGRIDLLSLQDRGRVNLHSVGETLHLQADPSFNRGTITLTRSRVDVLAADGGDLSLDAHHLHLTNSILIAGIAATLGTPDSQAGDVNLRLTGALTLDQSLIDNVVQPDAVGNGGVIDGRMARLTLLNGSAIRANTGGEGNASQIYLEAERIRLDGGDAEGLVSRILSQVEAGAVGNGGEIRLVTDRLVLTNGGSISSSTSSTGNAGNLVLQVGDRLLIRGESPAGFTSRILSQVEPRAVGDSGQIRIHAQEVLLRDGGAISASTKGEGDAGTILINAGDRLLLDGEGQNRQESLISSQVEFRAEGDGGRIQIQTGNLTLRNGTVISTGSAGRGDGGSILIDAGDRLRLLGENSNTIASRILSQVEPTARGDGGNINLTAEDIFISGGGGAGSSTFGRGDAGNITVHAGDRFRLIGEDSVGFPSQLVSQVEVGGDGDGGTIQIWAGRVAFLNGTGLSTSTLGRGDAGNIQMQVGDRLLLTGEDSNGFSSRILSRVNQNALGDGGRVSVTAENMVFRQGSGISTSTDGQGHAGDISLDTESLTLRGQNTNGFSSRLVSRVETFGEGRGGTIRVNADAVWLDDGALMTSSTYGFGRAGDVIVRGDRLGLATGSSLEALTSSLYDAGNIRVQATDELTLDQSSILASTLLFSSGNGGNIFIRHPNRLILQNGSQIGVNSQGFGTGGNVHIQANQLHMDASQISAETVSTDGGNLDMAIAELLTLRAGSRISTTAGTDFAGGDGGNIIINAPNGFVTAMPQENSDITANAYEGNGGNVAIAAQGIFGLTFRPELTPDSDITATSRFGVNGEVVLNTLGIDPSRGLVELNSTPVDGANLVNERCRFEGTPTEQSSFSLVGRGGIPLTPGDRPTSESVISHWVDPPSSSTPSPATPPENAIPQDASSQHPVSIVEATNWHIDHNGQISLIAQAESAIAPGGASSAHCLSSLDGGQP